MGIRRRMSGGYFTPKEEEINIPCRGKEMRDDIRIAAVEYGQDVSDATITPLTVLEGYRGYGAVGAVDGEIPVKTGEKCIGKNLSDNLVLSMPSAYYAESNNVSPYVYIPLTELAELLGIDASKMLDSLTVAGVTGEIETKDTREVDVDCGQSIQLAAGYYPVNVILNGVGQALSSGNISVSSGGLITIPKGYFSQAAVTKQLSTFGAQTITPGSGSKTVNTSGKFGTGNITIAGDADLKAANIKKGVNIFGITGTWEGYVASPTDLYYYGQNKCGLASSSSDAEFQDTQVLIGHNNVPFTTNAITFTGYSKLNFLVQPCGSYYENTVIGVEISKPFSLDTEVVAGTSTAQKTISVPLSNFQSTGSLTFRLTNIGSTKAKGKLLRIWLS